MFLSFHTLFHTNAAYLITRLQESSFIFQRFVMNNRFIDFKIKIIKLETRTLGMRIETAANNFFFKEFILQRKRCRPPGERYYCSVLQPLLNQSILSPPQQHTTDVIYTSVMILKPLKLLHFHGNFIHPLNPLRVPPPVPP